MDMNWHAILGRITTAGPEDLDPLIHGRAPRPRQGRVLPVSAGLPPAAELWQREDAAPSYIGVRICAPMTEPAQAALRLASAAIERRVFPIILSRLDTCGLERFGFRVERIPMGDPEAAIAAEDQLARFWSLAIIIDGSEIGLLD